MSSSEDTAETQAVRHEIEEVRAELAEDTTILRDKLQVRRRLLVWAEENAFLLVAGVLAFGLFVYAVRR